MQSFFSPFLAFKLGILFSPSSWGSLVDKLFKGKFSNSYLERNGVLSILRSGLDVEIPIVSGDLARLHKLIMSRKPKTVLEFGVGFSTIVISHALDSLGEGTLYTVDADPKWLENTRTKLGEKLSARWEPRQSDVDCAVHDAQLVSYYKRLPNIVPQFVYLDGPSPSDIKGNVRGLDFPLEGGRYRHVVASDILLYESSLLTGAYVLVDRRYANVQFLRNNLKRKWKLHWDRVQHQVGFELRDITGRSTNNSKG